MSEGEEKKKMNLGLNLLRVWLSFEVVADHFWHEEGLTGVLGFLSDMRSLAVPCFLLMSFYLTANRYAAGDGKWLRTRFGRLGVPYFIWPIVYFVLIWVLAAVSPRFVDSTLRTTELRYYGFDLAVDGWDLVRQWVFGIDRRLVHQFWFHSNLIFWTAGLFLALKAVTKERTRTYVLGSCIMLGLVLQYSGLNTFLFDRFGFEFKYSAGRLFATLPYAALALMVGFRRKAISEVRGGMRVFLSFVGLFLLFFVHYSKGFPRPEGLGYQGISLILMAFGTVMFFHYLPLEKAPAWLDRAIEIVSRYCMGIYCCHLFIGWILYAWVLPHFGIAFEGLVSNIWIWIASWAFCWLVARIPGRFAKDLVQ